MYIQPVHAGGSDSLMVDAKLTRNSLTFKDYIDSKKVTLSEFPECTNKTITIEIKKSWIFILKNKLLGRAGQFSDLDEIEKSFVILRKLKSTDVFSFTAMGSSIRKIKDCEYFTYSLQSDVGKNGILSLTTYLSF